MKKRLRHLAMSLVAVASANLAFGYEEVQPANFRALVCARNVWAGIDASGQLVVSSNRLEWRPVPADHAGSLYAVAYGNGRFVAVGDEGTLLTSTDGAQWTRGNSATDDCLRGVAFGNDAFLAVGKCGTVVSSKDGLRWHFAGASLRLKALAFGQGCFVAVGQNSGDILTSANGLTWKKRRSGATKRLARVAFVDGIFVAFDASHNRFTSGDGIAWASHSHETAAVR